MKGVLFTDAEIDALVQEPKRLSRPVAGILRGMKTKEGREESYEQNTVEFPRNVGVGKWFIYLRKSRENAFDFSCGFGLIPAVKTRKHFMLKRYNGKSHWHANALEKTPPFYDFHIHTATERYQQSAYSNDHYAETTGLYHDFRGAFRTLLSECHVTVPDPLTISQETLFE